MMISLFVPLKNKFKSDACMISFSLGLMIGRLVSTDHGNSNDIIMMYLQINIISTRMIHIYIEIVLYWINLVLNTLV